MLKSAKQNSFEESLIGTIRAMVEDESLQLEFSEMVCDDFFSWDQNLVAENMVKLPMLVPENSKKMWKVRAACDMATAYILFHDSAGHFDKNLSEQEQKFFDEFEKIRVIAEIKKTYLGAAQNILFKIEDGVFAGSQSLSLILLKEIFGAEILPRSKNFAEELEQNLKPELVREIKKLAQKTTSQTTFKAAVARILELIKKDRESDAQDESVDESTSNQPQKPQENQQSFGQENVEVASEIGSGDKEKESSQTSKDEVSTADLKHDDQGGEVSIKLEKSGEEEKKIEYKNAYKVYTTKFDEIVFPSKLVSKNELELLRDQLDLKLAKLTGISKKMSLKLKKKLLSKRDAFLERDTSRGILDRKKLSRLVIDPLSENIWIDSKTHEYQDTCLTILLDNSGSMRGNPIVMSAMACEIISDILEKFSVKTEIIGFTTADWKGGKARKLWESSGRPYNPGRLNELRHVIYKSFGQSLKKSKANLGLMLKEGMLKENIDGEALLFARSRLMQQSAKRKILLVISDGTPVDDSTSSSNDSDILTDHLRHVINRMQNSSSQKSKIELIGIGIGHATDDFYRNSIAIKTVEELGDVMIEKIMGVI